MSWWLIWIIASIPLALFVGAFIAHGERKRSK